MNQLHDEEQQLCSHYNIAKVRIWKGTSTRSKRKAHTADMKRILLFSQGDYAQAGTNEKMNKTVPLRLKTAGQLRINSNIDFNIRTIVLQQQQKRTILKRSSLRILKNPLHTLNYETLSVLKKRSPQKGDLSAVNQVEQMKRIIQDYDNNMNKTKNFLHRMQTQRKRDHQSCFVTDFSDPQKESQVYVNSTERNRKTSRKMQRIIQQAFEEKETKVPKNEDNFRIIPLNNQRIKQVVQQSLGSRYQRNFAKGKAVSVYDLKSRLAYQNKLELVRKTTHK